MRYAIVLTALVGCASVSDPPGLSVPGMFVESDAAVRVFAPGYQMDFSATGLHLPEHLLVNQGTVDLLGTDLPCAESRVGVAVSPAVSVEAGIRGKASRSEITPLLNGPAVVKVNVTYEVDYDCPNPETLRGESDFTLLPFGRIVREERMISPSNDRLGIVGQCGCQQETDPQNFHNLFLSSFWAFDRNRATQARPDGSAVTEDIYAACTMYPDGAIGVAWQMLAGTNTRFQTDATSLHVLDWASNATMLDPTARSITSAIQISNTVPAGLGDCAKVLALLDDVPIQIGNTKLDSTEHDGIYRDPAAHADSFEITAGGVAVPAGFVVSVDLGGASHARLSRSPAKAPLAIIQRESDTRFLIAFVDGLAPGESVTIEPTH
jgi:hypothetical protein